MDKPTLLGAQPSSVKTENLQPGLFLAGELSHRGLVAWFEEWPPKLPGPRPPGYGGFHGLDRVYGCECGSQTSRRGVSGQAWAGLGSPRSRTFSGWWQDKSTQMGLRALLPPP